MTIIEKPIDELIPYANNPRHKDPRYVDVIIKRWETLTGKSAVLMD